MAKKKPTGRINVYIRYEENFFGRLRPAYDSAADAIGELTANEASCLRSMISAYIRRCHDRHGKVLLDSAINRGEHA